MFLILFMFNTLFYLYNTIYTISVTHNKNTIELNDVFCSDGINKYIKYSDMLAALFI